VRLEEPGGHPIAVAEPVAAAEAVLEEAPAGVEEMVVEEEEVTIEPLVIEEPEALTAAEAPGAQTPGPEPPAAPPPPQPEPDLSKLFAPEDTQTRVFPTSHGPVPISNPNHEPDDSDSPEAHESSER
jgi:hypothetical protein